MVLNGSPEFDNGATKRTLLVDYPFPFWLLDLEFIVRYEHINKHLILDVSISHHDQLLYSV